MAQFPSISGTSRRAAGADLKTARNSCITLTLGSRSVCTHEPSPRQGARPTIRLLDMVLEAGKPPFSTLKLFLGLPLCHQTIHFLRLSGGDDGARTRDLCRDRAAL